MICSYTQPSDFLTLLIGSDYQVPTAKASNVLFTEFTLDFTRPVWILGVIRAGDKCTASSL